MPSKGSRSISKCLLAWCPPPPLLSLFCPEVSQRQGHLLVSPSRPTPKLSPVSLCILGLTQNYYKMIQLGYNFKRTNGAL